MAEIQLWGQISKCEQSREERHLQPLLNHAQVTPLPSTVTVSTDVTPVWVKSDQHDVIRGIWVCLATYHVVLTLPEGFVQGPGDDAGSEIRLGKIHIRIGHDEDVQPLVDKDGRQVLRVSCETSGPAATQASQSVSNTVSKDVGVNIGAFGDAPTGGLSFSSSLSHTVSEEIHDVDIITNMEHENSSVWWTFEFSGMDESPASKSTFNYVVQAIWRYQPLEAKDLTRMAYKVDIEWSPHAAWSVAGRRISAGPGDLLRTQTKVLIDNEIHAFQIPPSVLGVRKRPST
ncbi:hypothetical protein LX32DRAFT_633504 [Colletotrichum zoysiae]|uniref:Uncharacterized protein n=1 Tax=Colletotrichum zoysiae TaxID=1216348 RepID=A0AAD9HU58_9PEZI|nr:hypothetical protein LX32DRAFT_633504 [Colletotrichum zoysiae]